MWICFSNVWGFCLAMDSVASNKNLFLEYVKIARLDHWIKQLFIIPGFFVAAVLLHVNLTRSHFCALLLAFVATSFIASANYVINEWLDAKFDKFHPEKKNRPVVVSGLRFGIVMAEYAFLLIAGLVLSFLVNRNFGITALVLLIMGVVYNVEPLRTKDIPFLDVLSESVNNMLRLLLGWFVIARSSLPPSSLAIGYWMGGAFLMATKRFAEYRMIGNPEVAQHYRKSFKKYTEASLMSSAFAYALLSTFLTGVFLTKYRVELVISIPFLVALFAKYVSISYRADSAAQKPEKLYREKGLLLLAFLFVVSIVVGLLVDLPSWVDSLTGTDFIKF